MSMKLYESVTKGVSKVRTLTTDDFSIASAKVIFEEYRACGVIINKSFCDDSWLLTNHADNITLTFMDENYSALEWIGCDSVCYREYVKIYIAQHLGKLQLSSLQVLVRLFKRLGTMRVDEASEIVRGSNHVLALLKILPGSSAYRDSVIESLELYRNYNRIGGNRQRTLAEFNSYLKFNESIQKFWTDASQEQRILYFPVYLWWNLTAILPLRVTELLLTPRDCLEGNTVTVRRSKLKGGATAITYRVDEDYECCNYTVTDGLAEEIRCYVCDTEILPSTELCTLLRYSPHFTNRHKVSSERNRYFTYNDMCNLLSSFLKEISQNAEFNQINLGDTRHIAMINLIISGGSPVICKELAGHADINISSHYYANISTLVECITLERFRKSRGGAAQFGGTKRYPATFPENAHCVSGGVCDAQSVISGDISECLKVIGNDGEIGNCEHCTHFWSSNPGIHLNFRSTEVSKQLVDMDSQYLISMIEAVRRGLGYQEDIGRAVLRLQHSCNRLTGCLTEQYLNEEIM